jgi:PIN domain
VWEPLRRKSSRSDHGFVIDPLARLGCGFPAALRCPEILDFGNKATPVEVARTGKNAQDFHLSFCMGCIAARHADARFVVASNDKGYAPMLEHANELGFAASQVGFGDGRSAAEAGSKGRPSKKPAAKQSPTKSATRKAIAEQPSTQAAKAPLHDTFIPPSPH